MKKHIRFGFTLVELLVVISIIGMLAGLLLPAVNAAREAGRRATCVSNQSNVALALLNYESARGEFPPLRVYLEGVTKTTTTPAPDPQVGGQTTTTDTLAVSWVAMILANMEFNTAWAHLSTGRFDDIYDLTLPVMRCKSATQFTDNTNINYVVNGGYQNVIGKTKAATITSAGVADGADYTGERAYDPGRKQDAVFFDHTAARSTKARCKTSVSVDYISTHAGMGYVLLLSENVNAGQWFGNKVLTSTPSVTNASVNGEAYLAFSYPYSTADDGDQDLSTTLVTNDTVFGNMKTAFGVAPETTGDVGTDSSYFPLFINVQRTETGSMRQQRLARPSSNHPGIAVAAFADRSVRPLSEFMDKGIFIRICQPASGAIVKLDNL